MKHRFIQTHVADMSHLLPEPIPYLGSREEKWISSSTLLEAPELISTPPWYSPTTGTRQRRSVPSFALSSPSRRSPRSRPSPYSTQSHGPSRASWKISPTRAWTASPMGGSGLRLGVRPRVEGLRRLRRARGLRLSRPLPLRSRSWSRREYDGECRRQRDGEEDGLLDVPDSHVHVLSPLQNSTTCSSGPTRCPRRCLCTFLPPHLFPPARHHTGDRARVPLLAGAL
jgi:hypothetical protein